MSSTATKTGFRTAGVAALFGGLLLITSCDDPPPVAPLPEEVELGACLYSEPSFGGDAYCVELTAYSTGVINFEQLLVPPTLSQVASVRVFGAVQLTLFDAPFGQGEQVSFTEHAPVLPTIYSIGSSSFELSDINECSDPLHCGSRTLCTNTIGGFDCATNEACVHSGPAGAGESFCIGDSAGPRDLPPGLDRNVGSIRITGAAIVTLHTEFGGGGESRTFVQDAELADDALASSARSVTIRAPGVNQLPGRSACMADASPPPRSAERVALERVYAVDFIATTSGAFSPTIPQRLYMAEKTGTISFAEPASPAKTVALDLTAHTYDGLDAGVLAIAFSPEFATDGEMYVVYNRRCADAEPPAAFNPVCPGVNGFVSRLARFTSMDGGDSFDPASEQVILDSYNQVDNHTFGAVVFGPDQMLYVATGDGGNDCAACRANGQDRTSLRGKILRLDVLRPAVVGGVTQSGCVADDVAHYCIPSGNPYADNTSGYAEEIWAYGLRNPWRMSFDDRGRLWAADVGQVTWEEVDLIEPGGNYGWATVEGPECFLGTPAECASTSLRPPIAWYDHATGNSITGGHVYRGSIESLRGAYVFADFVSHRVWALWEDGGAGVTEDPDVETQPGYAVEQLFVTDDLIVTDGLFVPSFLEDADGELYIVVAGPEFGFNDSPGAIYRFTAPAEIPWEFPETLSETGCFTPNPWTGAYTIPSDELLAYDINAPFWSDTSTKTRFVAMPETRAATGVGADGDFDLPIGTVLVKDFSLRGRRVETRFLIRHDDGQWTGYTYRWREDQLDADFVPDGADVDQGEVTWHYPTRAECMQCHGVAAGRSLGIEARQLDRLAVYDRGRRASELDTWSYLELLPWLDSSSVALARFSMDEGAGSVLNDPSGASITVMGNVAWAPATIGGRARSALTFDGTTYAQTTIPSGGERTLAAWIRPTSSEDVPFIESVIDSDAPGAYGTGFGLDNGEIAVVLDDEFWETGVAVDVNQWQHVAVTIAADEAVLYVDGVLQARHPYAQGDVDPTPYVIGKSNANDLFFHGQIADVAIYPSVLAAADIARIRDGERLLRDRLPPFPDPLDPAAGSLHDRARSWLHTNCAQCHRPRGNGQGGIDLRFDIPFADTGLCNAVPQYGRAEIDESLDPRLFVPRSPETSVLYARIAHTDPAWRMPSISSLVPDEQGLALMGRFIESFGSCP